MVADTGLSANFSATPLSGDDPLTVNFTDISSSDDGIVSWLWNFGDGDTSNVQNPSHVYTTEGTYTVSLTISEADSDSDTKTRTNYITVGDTVLLADFSATPLSGEDPLTISFTDTSSSSDGIVSWLWDFGDGDTSNVQNPSHEYIALGTYTVSLTVTEADSDSDTKTRTNYITVGDTGPSADFLATPLSGDDFITVSFTDTSSSYDGIVSWLWDFGDGDTSNVQNPSHEYSTEGTYTVSLTVTEADSDSDTKTRTNYITVGDTMPSADFSATPLSGDDPLTVIFTDASSSSDGIVSWLWDFGDGDTSTEQNPSHEYSTEGIYTVSLTVTEADSDSDTKIKTDYIKVADTKPSANFTAMPRTGDDSLAVIFTDTSISSDGINNWLWDFGDGDTSTEQNPSHVYSREGAYTISLTVTEADSDTDTDTKTYNIIVMVKEAQSSLSWILVVAGLGGLGVILVTSSAIIITKRR